MKNKKITFIGAGNMGGAILSGLITRNLVEASNVTVFDTYEPKLAEFEEKYKVNTEKDVSLAVKQADIVILAVKPNVMESVLQNITSSLKETVILVSIAAGVSIENIIKNTFDSVKVARIMPNTPAMVGEGMSSVSVNDKVTEEEANLVLEIFNSLGKAELVPESLIDAVTGLSGSGPAYVYMFIEALADGAVVEGMPRDKAYKFAAQTVLGAAKMVLETGMHPGALKDMVTSPGGTTIAAVKSLEANGLRNAVIEAVGAATQKSRDMKK